MEWRSQQNVEEIGHVYYMSIASVHCNNNRSIIELLSKVLLKAERTLEDVFYKDNVISWW